MQASRRYFVGQGPEADALRKHVFDFAEAQHEKRRELINRYGANAASTFRNGTVFGLAFLGTEVSPPEIPKGLKLENKEQADDGLYFVCKPDRRTVIGKKIAQDMKDIKPFSGSDFIVDHFKASRWVPQDDRGSCTGMSMAISVAGIIKERIFLSVPVCDKEPFEPPHYLREIKKSEYIALTEE